MPADQPFKKRAKELTSDDVILLGGKPVYLIGTEITAKDTILIYFFVEKNKYGGQFTCHPNTRLSVEVDEKKKA